MHSKPLEQKSNNIKEKSTQARETFETLGVDETKNNKAHKYWDKLLVDIRSQGKMRYQDVHSKSE